MATRSFTKTRKDNSGRYNIGLIDTAAAAGNKLVTTDVTDTLYAEGIKTINFGGTYVKGSSTNGKLDLYVDGVLRKSTSTSTTDGEQVFESWTGPIYASAYVLCTITGTATGASVNYAYLSIADRV